MSWNYRILAHQETDGVILQVHTVYYVNDKPVRYSENPSPVMGETADELIETTKRFQAAHAKPILWAGEKFPEIYKNENL